MPYLICNDGVEGLGGRSISERFKNASIRLRLMHFVSRSNNQSGVASILKFKYLFILKHARLMRMKTFTYFAHCHFNLTWLQVRDEDFRIAF